MKAFPVVVFSLFTVSLFSQGPVITPLKGNARLKDYNGQVSSGKRALPDTVKLPFFDDFTTTKVYPDMRLWEDSQVYINSTFPKSPPSYGVATFDNLDKKGAPYRPLSGLSGGASDTLTSRIINLKTNFEPDIPVAYKIADSIYLSFFYQTQGIGDPLDGSDSLVLKFKDTGGDWRTVWKVTGSSVKPFRQVLVGILDARYLSDVFQFRFINFGKNTGNMNQWHLDYVRMKDGRNRYDTAIRDVAINAVPIGPLKIYETMPYSHFKLSPATHVTSSNKVIFHNHNAVAANTFYSGTVANTGNTVFHNFPKNLSRNTPAFSDDTAVYLDNLTPKLINFTEREPVVRIRYFIKPPDASDKTPGDYGKDTLNNVYIKNIFFKNYYAYDDGSAEGGYGLDYGSLPAGPGYSAMKFQLFKGDTLGGISVFFNRSVADVTFKPFTLMVWQKITDPPANNMNSDVVLKRVDMITTRYADSINGFVNIIFDTALVLAPGSFYIGWQQNSNFILNVGYDNNYTYTHGGGRNPNLFYNLNGYWEKVSSTITGVPMMRPLFGGSLNKPTSVRRVAAASGKVLLYPNPSGNSSILMLDSENDLQNVKVYDVSGKLCMELSAERIDEIDISQLTPGFYQVLVTDVNRQSSIHKYIKN